MWKVYLLRWEGKVLKASATEKALCMLCLLPLTPPGAAPRLFFLLKFPPLVLWHFLSSTCSMWLAANHPELPVERAQRMPTFFRENTFSIIETRVCVWGGLASSDYKLKRPFLHHIRDSWFLMETVENYYVRKWDISRVLPQENIFSKARSSFIW